MSVFFTKAGTVIAWLVFVPSSMCFAVVTVAAWTGNLDKLSEAFGPRFVASSPTFVQGIAVAVAFGIAAEISRTIAGRNA